MSADVRIDVSALIKASPRVVWELITDWERMDRWMAEASDFAVVSDHRTGVGVEAEATVRMGGVSTRDRIRVTGWEPERLLEIAHLGWVRGRGVMRLTPLTEATLLDWTEEFTAPLGRAGRIGLVSFRPLMVRQFAHDLRLLGDLAARAVR